MNSTFELPGGSICPHCHQPHQAGWLRVVFSGPVFSATCRACDKAFYPRPLRSWLVAEIVFFPFSIISMAMAPSWTFALALVAGAAAALLAVRSLVPLVKA